MFRGTSLAIQLALLLSLVVGATLLFSWTAVSHGVVEPFSRQVFQAFLDEAVFAADRVADGADPGALGIEMGLGIKPAPRRRPPEREGWRATEHRGHALEIRRSRGRVVAAVETDVGWVMVQRELDLDAPRRHIRVALLLVGIGVISSALLLARRVTRPLDQARQAMERVASGDLEWRLPEAGPKELVALAQTYNAMTARVSEMIAAEKSLMAGISHELRTPITRLRLEVELLRDLRQEALNDSRLDAMEGDLAELERLIAELLEISRLELGQQTLERGPLTLRAVADLAAERMPLPEHQVVVSGEGPTLEGDRERLVRVVTNLLQNAGKYAPPGTRIEVAVEGRALSVSDRGPGVPPEALERIFAPFYRQDSSRARATGGVGLGLMIARQIVTLHGGTIAATSRSGGGLTVRFTI